MASSLSTWAFTTVFVLVNFVFVSSVPNVYNAVTSKNVYILDTANRAPIAATKLRTSGFINFNGDMEIGDLNPDDVVYSNHGKISNTFSSVLDTTISVGLQQGVFSWLAVVNEEGSSAVFCGSPDSIGRSNANVSVRINPESDAVFTIYATVVLDQ